MKNPPLLSRFIGLSSLVLGLLLAAGPLQAQVLFSSNFDGVDEGNLPNGAAAAEIGYFSGTTPALPHSNAVIQSEVAREGNALLLLRDSSINPAVQLRTEGSDFIPRVGDTLDFKFDFLVPRGSDTGAFTLAPNGNVVQQFLVVYIKHAGQGSYVSLLNSAGTYVDTTYKITPDVWYSFEIQVRFEQAGANLLNSVYDLYITQDGQSRVAVAEGLTTRSFTEGANLRAILSNQPGQAPAADSMTYWDNLEYSVVPETSATTMLIIGGLAVASFTLVRKKRMN